MVYECVFLWLKRKMVCIFSRAYMGCAYREGNQTKQTNIQRRGWCSMVQRWFWPGFGLLLLLHAPCRNPWNMSWFRRFWGFVCFRCFRREHVPPLKQRYMKPTHKWTHTHRRAHLRIIFKDIWVMLIDVVSMFWTAYFSIQFLYYCCCSAYFQTFRSNPSSWQVN